MTVVAKVRDMIGCYGQRIKELARAGMVTNMDMGVA